MSERRKENIVVDEKAILDLYSRSTSIRAVARKLGCTTYIVQRTLKKHNATSKNWTLVERCKAEIIADYLSFAMTNAQMAKKYGISYQVLKVAFRRWKIIVPNRNTLLRKNGAWKTNGGHIYERWLAKYGKDIADKKRESWLTNSNAKRRRGKNHHGYGKPPHARAGRGISGWYRGHHFRSLKELAFMIELDSQNKKWQSGEKGEYQVKYQFEGKERTYHPDFVVENSVYEIKPKKAHADLLVLCKKEAAEKVFAQKGMCYYLVDVEARKTPIHTAFHAGLIRFDGYKYSPFVDRIKNLRPLQRG
jgi:hypothetical protein